MKKRIISFFICVISLFLAFVVPISAAATDEPDRSDFEAQDVMKDLSAVLSSEKLDAYRNGAGTTYTDVAILHTMEYGFNSKDMSNYGFYIYLYDPICTSDLTRIKAQLCLQASTNSSYKEYECSMLSKNGCFSKHKVELGDNALDLSADKRCYKISGVTTYNDSTGYVKDNKIGLQYSYSGNMKGYGTDVDTLACTIFAQDTITLETNFTYYRTASSEKGLYWQNQINTVYFSVPN